MTEFTPGPWKIGGDQSVWMASQSDVRHVRIDGPKGATAVVPLWPNTWEGEANARLIAAAPELLAALDRCQVAIGVQLSAPCDDLIRRKFLDKAADEARAAIAKARGPQATSPYLNKPLRTIEQAVRDSEGKS